MHSRRSFVAVSVASLAALGIQSPLGAAPGDVRSATAVAQVFGEGQKLIAVALEYAAPVDGRALSPAGWAVAGRTVTEVFASTSTDPADRAARGRYVIVALSRDDKDALLKAPSPRGGAGMNPNGAVGGPPAGGPPPGITANFLSAKADVVSTGPVRLAGGRRIAASTAPIPTAKARDLRVERFRQFSFSDPVTGDTMPYNLFLPAGYDPRKSYPLVLFMHDAGVGSKDPLVTLKQGLGAVIWTDPAEQAKRPCIVLAPQWQGLVVNDKSETSSLVATTVHLTRKIAQDYAVDRNRIYSTGQSGGAMATIAILVSDPDLFAAAFIVAGQWDPAVVKPLATDKLWIMVAEGDAKAFPGQNAILSVLEREGAKVARAQWDGRWSAAQFAHAAAAIEAQGAPINFIWLAKGTVVPPGQNDNPGANHVNTWRIAYTIEPIRDWLFRQRK